MNGSGQGQSKVTAASTGSTTANLWRSNQSYYTLDALISEEQRRDDFIVVCVWLLMLSFALISNLLIVIGIARNNVMRSATSYWFIISLAVCDIVMVIISFGHLVPATAFHLQYVEIKSMRNIIMIFFYDLFWYAGVVQLGLMAINRFVSIVYPMEYKNMFSRPRALLLLALGYFLGFLASLPTLFDCCHTLWDSNNYITVYEKPETWYKYIDMAVNSISLLLMIFSYSVIIYKVRESGRAMAKYQLTIRSRQNTLLTGIPAASYTMSNNNNGVSRISSVRPPRSQVSKKEMRLFIQFFVVSLVFLLTWTTWQWLPYMSESKWAGFAMTSLFFINNSVNPLIYFIFNTQLRKELHFIFCRHKAISHGQNKFKMPPFGRDININGQDVKARGYNEDGPLIDHGASLSSHTTSDEQNRPQLLIKNMTFMEMNTDITAV